MDLLQSFLANRDEVIEGIAQLLNVQKKPPEYQQDVSFLSSLLKDCFFTVPGVARDRADLRDRLEEARRASGFKPRQNPGNDIVDPAEMMVRAFHMWRQTRWPGNKGRIRYAHTLFNLYLIRCLALLTMRLWDDGPDGAGDRLSAVQGILDQLWEGSPADQPVLVRDARWLIPVAMSPTTDDLSGYFEVTKNIAETFSREDLVETQKAAVVLGGGHLRSQLRHLCVRQGASLDDNSVILVTRRSNALDVALLTQGLVPLLEAYEHARDSGDSRKRLELAAAICQGVSPDPELFLDRVDLLGPYSMIEHLFITMDSEGRTAYTAAGSRHLKLLQAYAALVGRLSRSLYDDCRHFRPVDDAYSPYGALYGFSSNLIELMAFKTLERDAEIRFGLEDVFSGGDADKIAWVNGWRKLPHVKPEVAGQYAYPRQFAADVFARIEHVLNRRAAGDETNTAMRTGRLYVPPEASPPPDLRISEIPELPFKYIQSSDAQVVAAHGAEFKNQEDLLYCRLEGEFLVSYEGPGGWVAITKDVLTEVLGAGKDAKIVGLPRERRDMVRLMCPGLIVE